MRTHSTTFISFLVIVPLAAFWVWMFWSMINNDRMPTNAKYLWTVGFLFAGILTAGLYYFLEYREK